MNSTVHTFLDAIDTHLGKFLSDLLKEVNEKISVEDSRIILKSTTNIIFDGRKYVLFIYNNSDVADDNYRTSITIYFKNFRLHYTPTTYGLTTTRDTKILYTACEIIEEAIADFNNPNI